MQYTSILLTGASLLASVSAHGLLSSPQPRLAGDAFKAACGTQVYYNQASDSYGNIQGELQVAASQSDYNAEACNIWLCKGFKLEDNPAVNVQSYTPGQVVPMKFDLRAPHAGVANVSIIDTATNKIIGTPLKSYDDFGNNAYTTPADQLSFSITIPTDLGSKCAVAGACVIQHWWDAASINQSYESCVDFTVSGSGAAPAPVASFSAAAPAPTSTAAAPVVTSAVPTTLQTMTRPAASTSVAAVPTAAVPTTSAAAPVVTPAPTVPVEEDDDCEEL